MDWIASILELTGLYVVGNKNKIGFTISMLGCISWIVYVFISKSTYGLLLAVIPAFFINFRNFLKWSKHVKD